uniref:Uncharacterized protein n=1 Tax=Timema tahoe TaxID=61484 RepID=A0A7R9ICC2_9NEOP|nr:unnamed protein product [Timema tahoe]
MASSHKRRMFTEKELNEIISNWESASDMSDINYIDDRVSSSSSKQEPEYEVDANNNMTQIQRLDIKITFQLLQHYLIHTFRGERKELMKYLETEESTQLFMLDFAAFYRSERIHLLQCINIIVTHCGNKKHPLSDCYTDVIEKIPDDILELMFSQLISALNVCTPTLLTHGELMVPAQQQQDLFKLLSNSDALDEVNRIVSAMDQKGAHGVIVMGWAFIKNIIADDEEQKTSAESNLENLYGNFDDVCSFLSQLLSNPIFQIRPVETLRQPASDATLYSQGFGESWPWALPCKVKDTAAVSQRHNPIRSRSGSWPKALFYKVKEWQLAKGAIL